MFAHSAGPFRFAVVVAGLLLFARSSSAQSALQDRNAVYLELAGSGGLFSINYEREIRDGVRARIGFGWWTTESFFSDAKTSLTTVPVSVARLRGRGAHRLELGGGVTFGNRDRESFSGASGRFVSLTGLVGYRFHRPGRGFLFRADVTPFYGFGDEDVAYPEKGFFPSFGISLGYAF